MHERQKWIDHNFETGVDVGWTMNVLCRLQDSAMRLEYHCKNLNDKRVSNLENNAWNIKQHIGHLADLESLWMSRFQQFAEGLPELRAADMSNQKTADSSHSDCSIEKLITDFKEARQDLISYFLSLNSNTQHHQALHPRIKKKMRPIDLLFFIAEHDDHHITSIIELKKMKKELG